MTPDNISHRYNNRPRTISPKYIVMYKYYKYYKYTYNPNADDAELVYRKRSDGVLEYYRKDTRGWEQSIHKWTLDGVFTEITEDHAFIELL